MSSFRKRFGLEDQTKTLRVATHEFSPNLMHTHIILNRNASSPSFSAHRATMTYHAIDFTAKILHEPNGFAMCVHINKLAVSTIGSTCAAVRLLMLLLAAGLAKAKLGRLLARLGGLINSISTD